MRHVFWADTRILDYFLDPDVIDEKLTRVGTELYTGEEDPGEIYVNEAVEQELSDIFRKENGGLCPDRRKYRMRKEVSPEKSMPCNRTENDSGGYPGRFSSVKMACYIHSY